MTLSRRNFVLSSTALLATSMGVRAQTPLPDTMRIVVPIPPGNAFDASARQFAEAYRATTGRNCFVENKPGAATTIGANEVSRSKPDGSVVLWTTAGHITTGVLMKKLPYDPIEGFTPLTPVTRGDGFAMVTRTGSPFKSVQDVIDAAKKSPGKLSYASAGIGSTPHVVGALFAKQAGIDVIHVPYRADFLTDLIAGVTDIMFIAPTVVAPMVETGKLKLLGITGVKRADRYPTLPTFTEFGIHDLNIPAYSALYAPPNMPAPVLAALHEGVAKTMRNPTLVASYQGLGNNIWTLSPNDFKAHLQAELAYFKRTLPPLNIQMD